MTAEQHTEPGHGPRRAWAAALLVSALVLAGYVIIPSKVIEVYPLNRVDLFGFSQAADSRIVVQRSDGTLVEAWAWDKWHCEGPISLEPVGEPACAGAIWSPDRDGRIVAHIERAQLGSAHSSPGNETARDGGEPVVLVRQVVDFRASPELYAQALCPLAKCRVTHVD